MAVNHFFVKLKRRITGISDRIRRYNEKGSKKKIQLPSWGSPI